MDIYWVYGSYRERQKMANRAGVDLYVEHHFNSGGLGNYGMVLVGHNASEKSVSIAKDYARSLKDEFGISLYKGSIEGVKKLKRGERGDGNLAFTAMPAVLLEPLFVSNPAHVDLLLKDNFSGIHRLGMILYRTIIKHIPIDGSVAFSVGHRYKKGRPQDQGAIVVGTPFMEAGLAEMVLRVTESLLLSYRPGKVFNLF